MFAQLSHGGMINALENCVDSNDTLISPVIGRENKIGVPFIKCVDLSIYVHMMVVWRQNDCNLKKCVLIPMVYINTIIFRKL